MSYELKYPEYAQALYEALTEDAFYITLVRSIEDKQQAKQTLFKYLDFSICEGLKYGDIFMPSTNRFGVSVWSKPLVCEQAEQQQKEKKDFLLNELGIDSLETYNRIVEFMASKTSAIISSDAWYLSILEILPKYQGQGLGKDLLLPVLSKADRLGVSTYLETFTPRNKTFYSRLGYVDVGVFLEPTTGKEYSVMRREASKL